nr:protein FAR1-related sequence 5-like [Tanacetum cinerariifolium]
KELSDGTFNYKPIVDESEKPKIGREYSTIDKCIEMYEKYAEKSGFTIRKSTQEKLKSGIPARKYLRCNKEGLPKGVNKDTMSEETSENQIRTGINATETEYRNHKRDLNAHIGEGDAQMLITKMNNRKLHVDNFSFEYVVENSQLSALFLADEMSKYNYKEFGDTISFDATFRTNKKCVTFGAGMLSNETTKSYKWLLTCFLKAFNKQPRLVITDQDPAMKNAIASVFNESTHRLCMWHITNKIPLKVRKSTNRIKGFCQVGFGARAHGVLGRRCRKDLVQTLIIWQERSMDFESLSFEASFLDCFRKLPVDLAFVADFQSCVDIVCDASVEITAYTLALKNVEAQLLCHQQNQLAYKQKIRFMKIDLDDKTDVLAYHKKLLAEALKEKEDLKTKIKNWQNSSKNLSRLLNTQMSANDKFGLGYGDSRYGSILSYENEVLQSVFMNKEIDLANTPVNDRYATGLHAVPPPMIGNYMPSGPDVEIYYSKFSYGP